MNDSSSFDPMLLSPTQGAPAGGTPRLPGWDGLPFYGQVPDMKNADGDHKKPQVGMRAHVDMFVLNVPEELKRYRDIMQLVANEYAKISFEDLRYDEAAKTWRILLRWVELFTFMPKGHSNG